ncbi:hypothetical protein EDD85DRAFT_792985 [Armillaria nabsnona]|nr:hypothetical protein EDD85DRAFT_792985 [Armillaria nabsnona]
MGNDNVGEPSVQHKKIMGEQKHSKLSSSHHHHPSLMAPKNTAITSESDDENLPQVTRGSRQRISSTKQSEIDRTNQEQYMKKLERENKDLLDRTDEEYHCVHNGRDPPESEDEENEEAGIFFSSSIRSKGTVQNEPPKNLHKQGLTRKSTTELRSSSPPQIDLATGCQWEKRHPQPSHSHAPSLSVPSMLDSTPLPESLNHSSSPPLDEEQGSSPAPPCNDHPENSASAFQRRKCQQSPGPDDAKSDSNGTAKSMIHEVLQCYENKIFTVDAYPDNTKQAEIVHSLWVDVCESVGQEFELTAALQSMIKKRGARSHGNIQDRIQPMVAPTYGFQVSDKKKIQQTNKNLYVMLSTGGAFSFKKPGEKFRRFENKIIFRAICVSWFKNQKAPGIRYSDDYDPIKLESLALVMTILENCIEEWSGGKYVPRPLDEDVQCPRYLAHLADVKKCISVAHYTHHRICRSNSGAKAKEKVMGYLDDEEEESRTKADLEGRTGETDSEEEPDDVDGGDIENNMEVTEES